MLWEEGNISSDGQLPRYIDTLMDIYYLTNRSSHMKYGVLPTNYWNSNMQGPWRIDLQSTLYNTPNEEIKDSS